MDKKVGIIFIAIISFLVFSSSVNALTQEQVNVINQLSNQTGIDNVTLINFFISFDTYSKEEFNNITNNLTYRMEVLNSSVNLELIHTLNDWKNSTIDVMWANITKYNEEGVQGVVNSILLNYTDTVDDRFSNLQKEMLTDEYIKSELLNHTRDINQKLYQNEINIGNMTRWNYVYTTIIVIVLGALLYKLINKKAEEGKRTAYTKLNADKDEMSTEDVLTNRQQKEREKKLRDFRLHLFTKGEKLPGKYLEEIHKKIMFSELNTIDEIDEEIEVYKKMLSVESKTEKTKNLLKKVSSKIKKEKK